MKSRTKKKSNQNSTANGSRRAKTVVAISSRTKVPKFRQGYTVEDIQFLEEMIGECFQWTVGGVERLIDSGDTVVLKPNMAIETATPEMCMATDPRVMEALIQVIKKSVENVRIVVHRIPDVGFNVLEKPVIVGDSTATLSDSINIVISDFRVFDAYTIGLRKAN